MSSADNLYKQFGQNVGPDLDPNCLTLIVFLKDFFEKKVDLDGSHGKGRNQNKCLSKTMSTKRSSYHNTAIKTKTIHLMTK